MTEKTVEDHIAYLLHEGAKAEDIMRALAKYRPLDDYGGEIYHNKEAKLYYVDIFVDEYALEENEMWKPYREAYFNTLETVPQDENFMQSRKPYRFMVIDCVTDADKGKVESINFATSVEEFVCADDQDIDPELRSILSKEAIRRLQLWLESNTIIATDIVWDFDDKNETSLPKQIVIPQEVAEKGDDAVSDYLSDVTGFCHKGYVLERRNAR